ncbi:MAG TPA: dihydrolipoyl dehydrogenase [Bacillota bacterium]|jgi:dihydrolipoamide dehydrogenase|nr:dihydrolipoyl dehydrogenase [Bacillota bacterium]HOJ84039.1 dihydrolipoyl dehydrogenase [Bacillota bacterium]HOL14931.1 dihydrolipoyl dehydrogenase [Bacillota bacterium]HPZ11415.1 dihydrolipoyl dehydrogenase [Bacillota bacterium]HQE10311.1 dihydrolipoyl dehydrogenase [Bacillota bacterium]
MDKFQLAIIGGGPGGYSAALRGAALGLKTLLVEEERLGGTCLNHGCIPTKSLLHSASLYRSLKSAGTFGITAGEIGFDYAEVQKRKSAVVENLVGGLEGLLKSAGVTVWPGRAELLPEKRIRATLPGGEKRTAEFDKLIIATGSSEVVPPVPGVDLPGVIFSKEALALSELPASLAVIGGGVIALEMATIFAAFGVAVTIVQRSVLLRREDREMVRRLTPYLRRQGIRVMTETALREISAGPEGELVLALEGPRGEESLTAEKVLVAVGRKPSFGGLDLEASGIKHVEHGIEVDEKMATNVPGVYAIGDVANPGYFLAHTAIHQGIAAAQNAAGGSASFSGKAVPVCIFTHPELARAGLTEEEAKAKGYAIKVGKFPFSANGKAFLQGEGDGVIKIIAEAEKGTVLGVHILGPHASDLIQEGTLAVAAEAKVSDLERLIHPHPTLSETFWEAALSVSGRPLHLSTGRAR